MEDSPQKLHLPDNKFIAYHKHEGKQNHPFVIFLGGFMSDMSGIKATSLEKFCKNKGYSFIRFDYFGHGQSSLEFTDCTISTWKQNVLDVIDNLTSGKQILIGSSMGGWLMILAALARPERIAALIGIASAPDFTEELIWEQMNQTQQAQLLEKGIYNLSSEYGEAPYPITLDLIEDGRKHLLLKVADNSNNDSPFTIHDSQLPIRLIHGLKDKDVPSSWTTRMARIINSNNIKVNLVENGDHRMSTPENIKLLCDTLEEVAGLIK